MKSAWLDRTGRILVVLVAAFAPLSWAQEFPSRPISIVVSFSPGGVTDIVARMLAEPLSKELGQPVIVENITGAGGNIAFIKVAQASPNGYTLLLASTSTVTNPALQADKRFDPVKSYSPIGYVGAIPFWLLVNASKAGPSSVAQLVQQARSAPGRLTYGSGGVGTASHLGVEYFKTQEQLNILHIAYKGQSAAVSDLMGGTVDMVFMPISGTEELVRSSKLKALATTSRARVAGFEQVPSFAEAGFPSMEVSGWLGLVAPAGTPPATIDKLSKALNKTLSESGFKARLTERGLENRQMEPSDFGQFIEREVARWKDLVGKAGIKVE